MMKTTGHRRARDARPVTHQGPFTFSSFQLKALKTFRCLHCSDAMELVGGSLQCGTCLRTYAILPGGIIDALGRIDGPLNLAQRSGQWLLTAWAYDRFWRKRALSLLSGISFPPELEIEIVARTVGLESVEVLLDNACGNAYYGRALARKMARLGTEGVVIANDLSLPMLERALAYARQEGIADRMLFVRSDSERMPFTSKSIDAITCGGSFNEFQKPEAYLVESSRVLTPGGSMSLMCQVRASRAISAAVQGVLGRVTGLRFPSYEDLIGSLTTYLSVEAVLHVGAVMLSKLKPQGSGSRRISGPAMVDPRDLTISAPISPN
jgi:SAM-dependent methyltransferase